MRGGGYYYGDQNTYIWSYVKCIDFSEPHSSNILVLGFVCLFSYAKPQFTESIPGHGQRSDDRQQD